MANELNAALDPSQTGLTVVARLRVPGGNQQGSDIACTEHPSRLGWYRGSVPGGVPAGVYAVEFFASSTFLALGDLTWDGTAEVTEATWNVAIQRMRKVLGNRVVVSGDELTVTVYEDDGTTVAFTFSISADKLTRTPT